MDYVRETDVDRRLVLLSRVKDSRRFLDEIATCDEEGLRLARAFFDVSTDEEEGYEEENYDEEGYEEVKDEGSYDQELASIVAATEDAASTIFHALRDDDTVKAAKLAPILRRARLVLRSDVTVTQLADLLLDARLDLDQLDTIVAHALAEPPSHDSELVRRDPFFGRPRFGVSCDWRDKLRRANGVSCTRHHPDPGGGPCLVGVDFDTLDNLIGPP